MIQLIQDMRFAARQLRRSPGFALTSILVLGLGIGTTTGMIAVVQGILLRPLRYPHADRLALVGISATAEQSQLDYPRYKDMQRSLTSFDGLAAYSSLPAPVETADGAQMLMAPEVTSNFFDVLGVRSALGSTFHAGEDAADVNGVVLSDEFWRETMHARRDVLGSSLKVNGRLYTVIGVMPAGFEFPSQTSNAVWTRLQLTDKQKTEQGFDGFTVLGRLKPGVTRQTAQEQGEAYVRHLPNKDGVQKDHLWIYPYLNVVTGDERPALLAMLAACLLLLVIAVVNTANLQIARMTRREAEMAMRAALGASRLRLVRQMIVESLSVATLGAIVGWALAFGYVRLAVKLFDNLPRMSEVRLDPWVLLACAALTMLCGVAAAIAPAVHIFRSGNNLSLQRSASESTRGSRSQRLTGTLVASEVALTAMLLIGAGLFMKTFSALERVPLGFEPSHVTGFLLWPQVGNLSVPATTSTYEQLLERLQHIPGVEAAGMVTTLPISNFQMVVSGGFSIPGHIAPGQKNEPQVRLTAMSPGYFSAMRIPIRAGRGIVDQDRAGGAMVGVINEAFARKYLQGVNPIGQQIVLDADSGITMPITVVGMGGDVIQGNNIGTPVVPEVAISYQQLPLNSVLSHFLVGVAASFAVRTNGSVAGVPDAIRNAVKTQAPEFAPDDLVPMDAAVVKTLRGRRMALEIASAFGALALLLAMAGVYGVLAYLVSQRVREIGIRVALGASRQSVLALIFRQGLLMVGVGLLCGFGAALAGSQWIKSFLFGTATHDVFIYAMTGVLILLASAVAIYIPARRAASIDPMTALRSE
jgi:putative ABC transport system permease protein